MTKDFDLNMILKDCRVLDLFGDERDDRTWLILVHVSGTIFQNCDTRRPMTRTLDPSNGRFFISVPFWDADYDDGSTSHKKIKKVYCYQAVAKCFCPNARNLNVVHHIDGNPQNDRAQNLIYVTPQEHGIMTRYLNMIKKENDPDKQNKLVEQYNRYLKYIHGLNEGQK